MKTKTLIILSICLLIFTCGETKAQQTNKSDEQKQKPIVKTKEKEKTKESKKEKILESLPSKVKKHVHGHNCGHDHKTANSSQIAKMTQDLDERLKLANMLPDDIRNKIEKMLANREIDKLGTMSQHLAHMGDYKIAFLIASNFLAHAETETEKQMASSFYADLSAFVFNKCHKVLDDENKEEYENIKNLLKKNLKNTPNNLENNPVYKFLIKSNFEDYSYLLYKYEKDLDSMYEIYDASANKFDKHIQEKLALSQFIKSYSLIVNSKNYDKIKLNDNNIERMLKYLEQINKDDCPNVVKNSPLLSYTEKCKKSIEKYKKYQLNIKEKNELK